MKEGKIESVLVPDLRQMQILYRGFLVFLSLTVASCATLFAATAPEVEWERTFGGADHDVAYSGQQTSDGGYIVAGYTYSYGAGQSDFWLVKVDPEGNLQWSKTFGGTSWDEAYSVQQTTDRGYIVAGYTASYGAGQSDFWLVKVDSDGSLEWSRTFGGPKIDVAYSVQQTTDGGYIVAGYTYSYGAGQSDFWLVKVDSDGNLEWSKTFGGTEGEKAFSVQQTTDGGYIVAGCTDSYGAGGHDFWLVKVDPDGNLQWSKTFGGTGHDVAHSVQQTTDGGYIIAGSTHSYGAGESDFWLVRVEPDGNLQWEKTFGGAEDDWAYSVQQTTDGGYIAAGYTYSYGAGQSDFWLVKVDPDGNLQWSETFGGVDWDYANSVQQTTDGGCIVAGCTDSYGAGYDDIYIIKLKPKQVIDTIPPSLITDFSASDGEDGQSTLTWTNPSDTDLAEVVVRRKTSGYPADHTDGELVYRDTSPTPGQAVSCTDTGLTNGTTYYYAVFSRDDAGNWNDTVQPGKNADTATPEIRRSITVISPNGGEEWPVGSTQEIKWEGQNAGAYVKIEYSTDGGNTWKTVVDSTDNDGTHFWSVPNDPSESCRVKVTSLAYPSVYDLSDSNFAIVIDTTPPSLITDLSASDGEDGQSTLTWTNPLDADLAEILILRKEDGWPESHTDTDAVVVYQAPAKGPGEDEQYVDTGLENGRMYYYAVFSCDAAGNWNDTVEPGKNADRAVPGCEELPHSLLSEADRVRLTHKIVLDTAATKVSKRIFDFFSSITEDLALKSILKALREFSMRPDLGQLPKKIEWDKNAKLGVAVSDVDKYLEELRIVDRNDLRALWVQKGVVSALEVFPDFASSFSEATQDYIEDRYEEFCEMPSMKQIIQKGYDGFSSLRNCEGSIAAEAAENILEVTRYWMSECLNEEIEPFIKAYDCAKKSKAIVSSMQISILAGAGTLTLLTGGAAAPAALTMAVTGEAVCEAMKLGFTIGQALTLAVLGVQGPYFTNIVTARGVAAYEEAGLRLIGLPREFLPSLDIVEIDCPSYLLPGEVKLLTVQVKNNSTELPAKARLVGNITFDCLLPGLLPGQIVPTPVTVPIESPEIEIPPTEVRSIQYPVSFPLFLLPFGIPTGGRIVARVEYGWLTSYAASIEVPEQHFGLSRVLVSLEKGASAFMEWVQSASPAKAGILELEQDGGGEVVFHVTITVTNTADNATEAIVIDNIPDYLAPTNIRCDPQPLSVEENTLKWKVSLEPHEIKRLEYTFSTNALNSGDIYYLPAPIAEIHPVGLQQAGENDDTQSVGSISVLGMVHNKALSIKNLTVIPDALTVDQVFHLTATIENIGTDPLTDIKVAAVFPNYLVCLDDQTKSIDFIPPGGTATVSWEMRSNKAGTAVIQVRAEALFTAGDDQIVTVKILPKTTSIQLIALGPNPVPPEGCIFWLNLPDDTVEATLKIFDVDGALLVSIPLDPDADRYPETGRWTPQDAQGRLLGTGLYLYCVEIKHADGTVTCSPVQKMVIQR